MKTVTGRLVFLTLTVMLILFWEGPLFAMGVWEMGIVTKEPWGEQDQHIKVDNVKYTFAQKDVVLARHYLNSSGIWTEEPISLRRIQEGQKVVLKVQGHRIIVLYLEER